MGRAFIWTRFGGVCMTDVGRMTKYGKGLFIFGL